MTACVLNDGAPPKSLQVDVVYAFDRFDVMARSWGAVRIGQVAAIVRPMPWECIKSDGKHAYDLILSSIPWMVEAARDAGATGVYMPLCFDTRARAEGMWSRERDIPLLFCGTRGGNHLKREAWLAELADVVTIAPPTFGREYFRLLARAQNVLHVGAEWSRGVKNAMRLFEASGMGARVITDGVNPKRWRLPGITVESTREVRALLGVSELSETYGEDDDATLREHTYVNRLPEILDLVKELL